MPPTQEDRAREEIDRLLMAAGWTVVDYAAANINAARGVAIRQFALAPGHGFADYLLYVDGKAAGVVEAKKQGMTLIGVETQSAKYVAGLPSTLPAWRRPLPFAYESTGVETRFTNGLDPEPRSRPTFAFHKPETLAGWLADAGTFLARMRTLPPLVTTGLWAAQIQAVRNLEVSLAENRPRALIQMATGSGKTFTAITAIYRLIKFAGARRVLFLVDRGNLGRQTKKEFDQYRSPHSPYRFGEEFIVQHLTSNALDPTARVAICTIQRMYSMLAGRDLDAEIDEAPAAGIERLFERAPPIAYNPAIPIETFDVIVTDEAHRSIYNLWRQVLEYFDATLIGLTVTPSKQTFGFFNQNLVMEYGHAQAVADGVNVNYDVYRIRTAVTEGGGTVEAGYQIGYLDLDTRRKRWEELDEDFSYDPGDLDREVQTEDQIRTVIRAFRDRLFTEIFPGRTTVPKTLFFAKDDNHAEKIVELLREEFGKGNDFAQKITYRTTGRKPEELIAEFRNSFNPRIAVTVDMIATGTDIKPVEIVVFMRAVKSRSFFEQMKGRGVRVISPDDLRAVTPDAVVKDRFVIVDAVGVCELDKTDSQPLDRKKSVPFETLLQAVGLGSVEPEVLSSIAVRLTRLEHGLDEGERGRVAEAAGGTGLGGLARSLLDALDADVPEAERPARLARAVRPFQNPEFRKLLVELKRRGELKLDIVTPDTVIEAGFSEAARERARGTIESFEKFIAEHRDEITALQILYNRPVRAPLPFEELRALADRLKAPPHLWTESQLWQAYAALDRGRVRGVGARRTLTDLVSLVRFALKQENELVPFPERVAANYRAWLGQQRAAGRRFSDEQIRWLDMIRDHVAGNLGIEAEDFERAPFNAAGGLGKVHQLFGPELPKVLSELNRELAA